MKEPESTEYERIGSKRKRAATNENARNGGRPHRGAGRFKKRKATTGDAVVYSSEEDEDSVEEMDIESRGTWSENSEESGSDEDEEELEDGDADSGVY
jgi:hypothetical protein